MNDRLIRSNVLFYIQYSSIQLLELLVIDNVTVTVAKPIPRRTARTILANILCKNNI